MEQRTDKLQLPDKGRKEWVDFGKGISMFLVVLFHSEVYYPITDDRFSFLFFFIIEKQKAELQRIDIFLFPFGIFVYIGLSEIFVEKKNVANIQRHCMDVSCFYVGIVRS